MKARLQTSLGQQLVLTPQLRQAIHLLQLPTLELEAEIAAAVESNPLLEWVDDESFIAVGESAPASEPEAAVEPDYPSAESAPDWSGEGETAWGGSSGYDPDFEDQQVAADTLQDHLLWQLQMAHCDDRDRAIALALIDAIDEDGYLRSSLADIAASLLPDLRVGEEDIRRALRLVQALDPPGVGARSLGECLCLQLQALPDDTFGRTLAQRLCGEALEDLPRLGAAGLARQMGVDTRAMDEALQLLRSLDPRPGARYGSMPQDTWVTPDCVIWRQQGLWRAALASNPLSRLGIHRGYEQMIAHTTGEDARYLRGQLQEARWLLKNLEARGETLLKVVDCLLHAQAGYLEFGPRALRPLTLREVAAEIGMHESTVSRAVARKYARTPRGTVALRDFFASGVGAGDGGETSSTAIQDMIRQLVAAENPRKPLSDARLTLELKSRGVTVARRTVAKYREAIGIASSHERMCMA